MNYATHLGWLHTASDAAIALACLVISASLAYLAFTHRGARLSRAAGVFAALFAFGGATHACEAAGWLALGAAFKAMTAAACVWASVLAVRCIPAARSLLSRLASIDRRAAARLARLRTDPRYDTPEDREWQKTLAEIAELARMAREIRREGI